MKKQALLLLLVAFCNLQMFATDLYGDESNVISSNTVNAVVSFSAVGDNPWYWSTSNNYLRSASIGNEESSELELSIVVTEDACMSFDYLISSEQNCDYAVIKLDGEQLVYDSGVQSGKSESFLSPGSHTVTLNYHKDAEDYDNQDMAGISNLKFEKKSEWESRWSENVGKVLYQNLADATISFVNHSTKPKYAWEWSGSGKKIQSSNKMYVNAISDMDIVIDAMEEVSIDFNYTVSALNPLKISVDGETVVTSYRASSTNFRKNLSVGRHIINFYFKPSDGMSDGIENRAYISMFAVYSTCIAKGTCNENIKWVIDKDGTLEITGNGEIPDYTSVNYTKAPWFDKRDTIKKVVIGEGITRVGNDAVIQCQNLTELIVSNTVTSIGTESFMENPNLENITFSENLQNVGNSAFSNCYKLKEVILPSIVSIGSNAFISCTGMKRLVLGNSLSSIQANAFNYCISLESVYCNKQTPAEIDARAFLSDIPTTCKLFVPYNSSLSYSNADGWNVFTNIVANHFDMENETPVEFTITSAKWSTLILPYDAEIPTGMTVYSCSASEDDILTLEEQDDIIANTPYVVFGEPNTYNFTGIGSAWEDSYDEGWFTGVYVNTDVPENSYILARVNGELGFYKVTGSNVGKTKVAPYHCYLTPESGSLAKAFFFENQETGIDSTTIANDEAISIFDINGVELSSPKKGINIINGIKVIVK